MAEEAQGGSLILEIAATLDAYRTCVERKTDEWIERHRKTLKHLARYLPSGSGIDNGTKIEIDESKKDKVVLSLDYHHMNDNGIYTGWTHHQVIVRPSLIHRIDLRITGRDKNGLKDYLHETYYYALIHRVSLPRKKD